MTKIAIVTPHDYFHQGGVQEHVKAQAEGLRKLNYEVYIIAPRVKKTTPVSIPENLILLGQAAKIGNPLATTTELGFSVETSEIENTLNEHNFDIVHFHEPWVPVLSRQILSRSKARNVATFHAKLPENAVNKSIELFSLPYTITTIKYIDAITAVSTAAADFVKSVTDQEITIIPNGIDLQKFKPSPKKTTGPPKIILYVGRLEKRKGATYLIKAFKELKNSSDYRLVIVGDGPKRYSLEMYAKSLGVDRIEFTGFVTEEEKLEWYRKAYLFCSPALYGESFGIVLLEAMAMGVPVVAGDNPGYRCVATGPSRLGIIDPKNSKDFANRIELICEEKEVRDLLVDWGLEHVKKFDYSKIIAQYNELYKSIL